MRTYMECPFNMRKLTNSRIGNQLQYIFSINMAVTIYLDHLASLPSSCDGKGLLKINKTKTKH